ncbi:MAG: hypothetical protein HOE48_17415 [Candidatus Latescibacteria bacterium]|jgi:hypothetical protein|nr:hypothetical protein [Candidatus Latescibacterota bacterium]MBT4139702.1 hypothetical protein [Candidatus Latescibacterota bacterium]MBT5832004.1 hypothetical protein [Candidatus Latescibacterota bacterium]
MSLSDIRIHYATHFLKLSLWYVRQLMHTEGADFQEAVNKRVNIYRNTDFYEGGNKVPARGHVDTKWDAYLEGLKDIYDQHLDVAHTEGLESEGLDYLWPRVRGVHLKEGHNPNQKTPKPTQNKRAYACWTFDDGDDDIAIHIANVYQPQSPLSERYVDFVAMLLKLLRDTKERRPEVVKVGCGSWMNSIKPFQDMFPQSWHASARKSPRSGFGMGHWGQFVTREGKFHERNGQLLRDTGDFPFASLYCHAPIDDILGHLEANFPEAVAFLEK